MRTSTTETEPSTDRGFARVRRWLVGPAAAAVVLACGTETPSGPGSDFDTHPGPDADALECGGQDHPCSLSDVPMDVLERSDALAGDVIEMLEGGASMAEATAWLEAQTGVAELESDDAAMRFRLVGGRGTWVFGGGALVADEPSDANAPAAHRVAASPGPARTVVADESEEKRALVLSPFLWAFGDYDDGAAVAGILADTRGYEGRVTFAANETQTSQNVGVSSFEGWGQYQVVHVSSHGKRLCSDAGCRAVIFAGTLPEGPGSTAEKLHELAHQGIEHATSEKHPGVDFLTLTADFFRREYPAGVDDAVVFFNACQTFGTQATDLADAIHGSTSVLFGWDQAVVSSDATAAALALYEDLSVRGYPAEVAYDNLGDLKVGRASEHSPGGTRLIMGKRQAGGDLRIREVVWVLHPATGAVLTPTDKVAIDGISGDGEEDAVRWLVQVDGVKPELAGDMQVHMSVDGAGAEPVDLLESFVDGNDRWTVEGVLQLPYDLEEDRVVDFRAWTNLHDEGESEHETSATLTGEEPIMGFVWEFDAEYVADVTGDVPFEHTPVTATAELILTFEKGQDPQEPHPRYLVTGGTVTFDYSHTYSSCTWSGPPYTFEVTPENAPNTHVTFDTTVDPVLYGGLLFTDILGLEAQVACDGGFTDTATRFGSLRWLYLQPDEYRPVSADRRSFSGTYRGGGINPNLGWGHFTESTYTATRIE